MSAASTLRPSSVPQRRLSTRTRNYRGRLFVASAGAAFELNTMAEFIFRQVDGTRTLQQIGERVAASFGVPVDEAVRDAATMLGQLASHDVLEFSG